MNQKWMRILSWITVIALIFGLVFYGVRDTWHRQSDPAVTKGEWLAMLKDQFGVDISDSEADPDVPADGEYVAVTSMQALEKKRSRIAGQASGTGAAEAGQDTAGSGPNTSAGANNGTDQDTEALIHDAVEKNIVSRKGLKHGITAEDANSAINGLLNQYSSPENYPSYFEPKLRDEVEVIDATDMELVGHNDNYTEFTLPARTDEELPEAGSIVLVENEFGIAEARRITAISESSGSTVEIRAEEVTDPSEVMESVAFSGAADFSYLDRFAVGKEESGGTSDGSERPLAELNRMPSGLPGRKLMLYGGASFPYLNREQAAKYLNRGQAAKILGLEGFHPWEAFQEKTAIHGNASTDRTDLKMTLRASADHNNDTTWSFIISRNGEILDPERAEFQAPSLPELTDFDEYEWGYEIGDEEEHSENEKAEERRDKSAEAGAELSIAISDFYVTVSGYAEWLDPGDEKNFVDVNAQGDIEISGQMDGMVEGTYRLATIPVPIAATAGTISVNINFYLIIGFDGEISFTYTISGAQAGMKLSVGEGVKTSHGVSSTNMDVDMKAEGYAGFRYEAAVCALGRKLADPCLDIVAEAKVDLLPVVEGYEDLPQCAQLMIYAPVTKLKAHNEDDTFAFMILDLLGIADKDSYDLIDSETARKQYFGADLHIETEKDGRTVHIYKGFPDDVCTHKPKPKDVGDVLQEKLDEEVEKQQDTFTEMINRQIEEQINRMLWQSCYG